MNLSVRAPSIAVKSRLNDALCRDDGRRRSDGRCEGQGGKRERLRIIVKELCQDVKIGKLISCNCTAGAPKSPGAAELPPSLHPKLTQRHGARLCLESGPLTSIAMTTSVVTATFVVTAHCLH